MKRLPILVSLMCVFTNSAIQAEEPKSPGAVVQQPVRSTQSADLAKIERKIAKEPKYNHTPKYCLMVFGLEAKHRVWVVVDGERVFVDLSCNGDFVDAGESFKVDRDGATEIGDIVDPLTKRKHTRFGISKFAIDTYRLVIDPAFHNPKIPRIFGFANVTFADKPSDAPIVHFGGPLEMGLSMATIDDRPAFICAEIVTPGVGKGSLVYYTKAIFHRIDAKMKPDLELEFVNEKNVVVREKAKFYRENIESVYLYPVVPGKKDDKRRVKITLSFPDWKDGKIATKTFEEPIMTLDK